MNGRCRYCGEPADLVGREQACARCVESPACGRCGHPREAHTGVFRMGRTCAHVRVDELATLQLDCVCEGFTPALDLDRELLRVAQSEHGDGRAALPAA